MPSLGFVDVAALLALYLFDALLGVAEDVRRLLVLRLALNSLHLGVVHLRTRHDLVWFVVKGRLRD